MCGHSDECGICLGPFTSKEKDMVETPCGHCFHNKCITQWLMFNDTCPTCRKIFGETSSADSSVRQLYVHFNSWDTCTISKDTEDYCIQQIIPGIYNNHHNWLNKDYNIETSIRIKHKNNFMNQVVTFYITKTDNNYEITFIETDYKVKFNQKFNTILNKNLKKKKFKTHKPPRRRNTRCSVLSF
jgi:hypothetical protein